MNYKVEKTTSEVYTIRFDNHRDWFIQATVMEDRGYLALHTSHGDWQYRWGSPGMPFKEFLTTLDNSYLMCKLGEQTFFDGRETKKQLKWDILSKRREGYIKSEDARRYYDFVTKNLDTFNQESYHRSISTEHGPDQDLIADVYDCDMSAIPCFMDYEPSLKLFVKDMWPAFVEVLKKELSTELRVITEVVK